MERLLEGQTALVTGASSGIGAAVAVELGRRGARVAVNHRSSADAAEAVAAKIVESGGEARVAQADVSVEADVARVFDETLEHFGALDILVANAGIQRDASIFEMSVDDWRKVVDVNLTGLFLCARRAAAIFRDQGRAGCSRAAGKIAIMSSVHDEIPWAGHANYAAAKGGASMLMRTLAQELGPLGIRVVAVSPGAIRTDINREVWEDEARAAKLRELIPYGRIGEPEDVARTVAWLVSDEADYVTGATLYVDGGMTLYPGFADNG